MFSKKKLMKIINIFFFLQWEKVKNSDDELIEKGIIMSFSYETYKQ